MNAQPVYKRIVLKMSGEALAGDSGFGIDPDRAEEIAEKIKRVHDLGVQVAVVIGGGNIWRGSTGVEPGHGAERRRPHRHDRHGHERAGAARRARTSWASPSRVQTAVAMNAVAEPYIRLRAIRHLEKGRVVVI